MATARKDVELVIRARDQATKAVESISKAFETLTGQQDDLAKSGSGVDTALGRLGQAVTNLDRIFKGLSVADSLTKQFSAAERETDRLQKAMAETAAESTRLAQELTRAGASAAELNQQTARAAQAVEKQGAAAKNAQATQAALNKTLNDSIAARDKLVRAEARLTESITKQPAKIDVARERFERLSAEMAQTAEPTATFQKRFEAAVASLAKAEGKLSELSNRLVETRSSITTANEGIATLGTALDKASSEVTETAAKLKAVKSEYKELGTAAKTAANEQRSLVRAQEDITEALAQQEQRVEKAGQAMIELAGEQDKAKAAMAGLAAEARGPLLKAFSQQQSTMSQINNAFQANRKEIAALGAEMKRVDEPTREMVETYNKLLTASNQISSEYAQQKAALAALRAALREGVTDIDQLNSLYQRFAATLTNSSAALNRVRATQAAAAKANQELAASAERAAQAAARDAAERAKLASSSSRATSATDRLAQSVRKFYGESRTAMSWTQRLRGEILSLIAAYAGFYGVINVLGQVVGAYQMLEAATSRLNVVMDGDESATAQELDFIRRTAERLGIEFGTLAQEYSKFSIATKGTNLAGANTRKIFVSVAEAARVNKVSMTDMAGTFVALTQIVSKGAVQMEEVRQQLGDRLPGALQIMADGLDVTTAELIKMMEQGEVSSDALIGFADELEKRFGPQLANSLMTVTANMGFLGNTVTATLLAFAGAGYMESFNELIIQLNETMRSADFQAFVGRISSGVAQLIDLLTALVANFRLVGAAMTAIIGIRLIPVITGLGSAFMAASFNARMAHASFMAVQAGTASLIPVATAATGAVSRLSLAIKGLTSSTGIGLLLTAAATAFAFWGTGADEASEAMEAHRKVVDRVKNAYDAADKSNANWADTIKKSTITEARVALEKATAAREKAFDDLKRSMAQGSALNVVDQIRNLVDESSRKQVDSLGVLIGQFEAGKLEVQDFKDAVSEIAENATNDTIKAMAEAILENSDAAGNFIKKSGELEAVLRVLNGTATEADLVLLGLKEAAEAASAAFDAGNLDEFTKSMREMAGFIPELANELKKIKDLESIELAYDKAMKGATSPADWVAASNMRNQATAAVLSANDEAVFKEIAENTGVTKRMFEEIYGSESFKSTAYNDLAGTAKESEGTWTIGYGTIMIDGRKVAPGDTITQEKAMKAAVDEMSSIVAFIEAKLKVPVSDKQLEALVSYAYNAGKGSLERDGILQALNKGDYKGAANNIRNGVATSKGMFMQGLQDRRGREADLFEQGMNDPAVMREMVKLEDERLKTADDFREALRQTAEEQQFLIDIAKQDIIARETQKALRQAEIDARKAGVTLSDEEIAGIKERTAAQYADQAQQEAEKKVKEERAAIEERVNQLLSHRGELEAQLAIYKEQGNTDAVKQMEAEIAAVNEQLLAAVANAIAMHEAIGGAGAQASVAALQTIKLEAENLDLSGKKNKQTWEQVGQMFASGLTNAFMKWAQAVANGEDALKAAGEAFMQFAADFLIKIAEMIIQQAILNALQAIFGGGGGGGGGILGGIIGTGHTGGIVGSKRIGSGNGTRQLNPAVFTSAPRFHEGGFPGLMPGEVPAVLQEGEEVLSKSNPRNALNGGGMGGGAPAGGGDTKIVNAIDSASFLDAALSSKAGEKIILNYISANAGAVKTALGG